MGSAAGVERSRSVYFVNAGVDFALIGGVSIALYLAMRVFGDGARTEMIWRTGAALSWVINWPHFSATNYRLYHSRENTRQYPLTAFVIPVLLGTFMCGAFLLPDQLAPPLVKLFLIWSPWHFSGQTFGISLLYARRAGYALGGLERKLLAGFIFGTFLVQTASAEAGVIPSSFYAVSNPPLGLPPWLPELLRVGMIGCGIGFVGLLFYRGWRERHWPPPIVLLPAVTQFIWFVPGSRVASFNEFVPLFHSLQYLLIAWAMQLREKMLLDDVAPSRGFAWLESARWGVLNVVGGAGLFWALPRVCSAAGVEFGMATAVVLAGVQIHHFFVDGVIWKLKNPKVASPLLVDLADIVGPRRAVHRQVVSA